MFLLSTAFRFRTTFLWNGGQGAFMCQRSTHFFWNYLHDYDLQDPTISLSLRDSMVQGFLEDKFIIEQQQKTLDADPDFRFHGIVSDAPLAHFRRTLERKIQDENQIRNRPALQTA